MADCEAPSFSLGLDLLDSDLPDPQSPPHSPSNVPQQVPDPDTDPDSGPDPPRFILKRLRRGPPNNHPDLPPPIPDDDDDDDIEEFSDHENDVVQVSARSSAWNRSACSSSKVSLNSLGVLNSTPHSSTSNNFSDRKRKQGFDVPPASAKMETGHSGLVFPKLTASPLRRFQLLDSDSEDDISLYQHVSVAQKFESCNQSKDVSSSEQNRKTSSFSDQDLWKDFSPVKNVSVPTPVFNEVFEEYFRSGKDKEVEKSGMGGSEIHDVRGIGVDSSCLENQQPGESNNPVPPSHSYFFHEDPRIRQLVLNRLCHFTPLGVNRVNQQHDVSHIDYMGQFSNGGASKTQGVQNGDVKSSTRGKKRSRNLTLEESFNASEGWVDPKTISSFSPGESSRKKATKRSSTKNSASNGKNKGKKSNTSNVSCASGEWVEPKSSMPKDAGQRRVQASGHWFTSPDGRKVYVNKSGQELTGRIAYREYRKESGAGSKKSRKSKSTKRKNT